MRKKKMTREQAIVTLEKYADRLVRFNEAAYPDSDLIGCMVIGVIVPGKFGVADDFWAAMRALRKRQPYHVAWHND